MTDKAPLIHTNLIVKSACQDQLNADHTYYEARIAEAMRKEREKIYNYLDHLIIGIEGVEFDKRLDGDKVCIVLDINENQWNEYWQSLNKEQGGTK